MTEDELIDKYPQLFSRRRYLEVEPGWYPLIDDLCAKIVATSSSVQVMQVKEKFGGLRFYVTGSNDVVDMLIRDASDASYTICEVCGAPGTLSTGRWWKTVCEKHRV
jgi:hypothetical protein